MAEETKRIIHTGRDYFEKIDGHATVITGGSDQARQQVNAQQLADALTENSPKEEVSQLLTLLKQEVAQLDVPAKAKKKITHELEGAKLEVTDDQPDKPAMADKLQAATKTLKEVGPLTAQAISVGNMIGKAILWCGVQWAMWKYGA